MCYPFCGMVHIKGPLLLIGKAFYLVKHKLVKPMEIGKWSTKRVYQCEIYKV